MEKKRSSLFARLMFSVALPEILIFSIVAIISYFQLQDLFTEISDEKIENFQDELRSIVHFQDVSLAQMSRNIEKSAQDKMKQLRFGYFLTSDSIETADLERIRDEIGMNKDDAIYIINKEGVVVNTSFKEDLNFNLYSLDDQVFVDFLKDMFDHDFYSPQPMSLETKTRRFKKYIYQASKDHEYVIQLGFYSSEAAKFNEEVAKRIVEIENDPNDIVSIDLLLAPWQPFSLYTGEEVDTSEIDLIRNIFDQKQNRIIEKENESVYYIFFERNDTESIKWTGLLKVVYDKQRGREILMLNLLQKVSLFGLGMGILLVILFINVRMITQPVKNLSDTVRNLGEGKLDERAAEGGTKEIAILAQSFNQMAIKIESSHKEITRKNEEILASINYAKRIQEAILPDKEFVAEHLKEHFIYYKPKDIVAGDFYWFEALDNYIYIAAADCTGHGVPGAMVSVVCSNSLNRAVNELDLKEPNQILDAVRDLVIETFEKGQHDVKDGMDIGLCRIDLKKREVVFSGAQNGLYVVTNKDSESEPKRIENEKHMLVEYKADKQPIGKFSHARPFTQQSIKCKKGDILYLYSDGYPDQFGGPEGRKFMYKPFKRLLLSFYGKPMSDQLTLLDHTFEAWKGNESQIDDVCVIGIRL